MVGVDNLFDRLYQSHLSLYRQWGTFGIGAPGRSFWVRLEKISNRRELNPKGAQPPGLAAASAFWRGFLEYKVR